MVVERLAVSLEPDLAEAVRAAAGDNVSAWVADAARRKLHAEGLLEVIAGWEAEHGPITDDELAAARAARPS